MSNRVSRRQAARWSQEAPVEQQLASWASTCVVELCVGILRGILLGDDLTAVRDRLTTDLVTWSPHLFAVSRDQLLSNIGDLALFEQLITSR